MSEIPEQYQEQARDNKQEQMLDDMLCGKGDSEALWNEIDRILCSKDKADMDSVEDLSLKDIASRVCEQIADRMMNDGDLDEEAMELAQGASERFYEGDR